MDVDIGTGEKSLSSQTLRRQCCKKKGSTLELWDGIFSSTTESSPPLHIAQCAHPHISPLSPSCTQSVQGLLWKVKVNKHGERVNKTTRRVKGPHTFSAYYCTESCPHEQHQPHLTQHHISPLPPPCTQPVLLFHQLDAWCSGALGRTWKNLAFPFFSLSCSLGANDWHFPSMCCSKKVCDHEQTNDEESPPSSSSCHIFQPMFFLVFCLPASTQVSRLSSLVFVL